MFQVLITTLFLYLKHCGCAWNKIVSHIAFYPKGDMCLLVVYERANEIY